MVICCCCLVVYYVTYCWCMKCSRNIDESMNCFGGVDIYWCWLIFVLIVYVVVYSNNNNKVYNSCL